MTSQAAGIGEPVLTLSIWAYPHKKYHLPVNRIGG